MQNYCLDTLECLLEANFIRMDAVEKKTKREELQKEAIVKLKLLGYVSYDARVVNDNGNRNYNNVNKRNGGARPDSLLINPIKVDLK